MAGDKKNQNIEYKTFDFEIKNIIEEDPDIFQFTGYASTFGNRDSYGDVVVKGAFRKSLLKRLPVVLWQHEMKNPVGVTLEAYEDDIGLYVKGSLPKSDTFVSGRVIPQMKIGSIKSMSIGYCTVDEEIIKDDDEWTRYLKEINLYEYSLVTMPANDRAVIHQVKSATPYQDLPFPLKEDGSIDLDFKWSASDAVDRVKDFISAGNSSIQYKNTFLWSGKLDTKSAISYKLQVCDVVEGKLMVIPKAVFAAAASISGSKDNVDISTKDKLIVETNINKYYEKMGKDSPLKKGFVPYLESATNITDVSFFLKNYGMSNSLSNSLISTVKRMSEIKKEEPVVKESAFDFSESLAAIEAMKSSI